MVDEQKLCEFLATLYEYLKEQRNSVESVQSSIVALLGAVYEEQPALAKVYEQRHAEFVVENRDPFAAQEKLFETVIQKLRMGKL